MQDEFHKPFIKSLITIVFFTIFAMIGSHFILNKYSQHLSKDPNVLIYTAQESQNKTNH